MFTAVDLRYDRLGDPPGALLAHVPHCGGHLCEGRRWLMPPVLKGIEPLVKTLVELLAQGAPLFSCTHLLERDNLSSSPG